MDDDDKTGIVGTVETREEDAHSPVAKAPGLFQRMMVRRNWKDLSPAQKASNITMGITELVLLGLALLDLRRRPASEINGSKRIWVMTSFIQPFGPIIYFLFGRKKHKALAVAG